MSADTEDAAALAGLDNLETTTPRAAKPSAGEVSARVWKAAWPKLLAVVLAIAIWELVYVANFKPHVVLPGPFQVLPELWKELQHAQLWKAIGLTLRQAVYGFALALIVGTVVGLVVARVPAVRAAVGSLITGLQTLPSVAWIPFAIILFGNNTTAILFMVIITAAPSIANGLIAGVDFTPPLLLRAGKSMGLRRFGLYKNLVMPAALPPYVAGLKQGWAFAWHGLLAGELLVIVPNSPSIGALLVADQDQTDMVGVIAIMLVILILGVLVDVLFNNLNESLRRRRGLTQTTTSTARGWKLATGIAR
jgi:NitT/TauT family transport system permease protein